MRRCGWKTVWCNFERIQLGGEPGLVQKRLGGVKSIEYDGERTTLWYKLARADTFLIETMRSSLLTAPSPSKLFSRWVSCLHNWVFCAVVGSPDRSFRSSVRQGPSSAFCAHWAASAIRPSSSAEGTSPLTATRSENLSLHLW